MNDRNRSQHFVGGRPPSGDNVRAMARVLRQYPQLVTDFERLLEAAATAYHDADQEGRSPDLVEVAIREQIAQAPAVPAVSLAPISVRDAVLGRSTTVKYQPTQEELRNGILPQDTVVFWQGSKREAQALTLDIGVIAPDTPSLGSPSLVNCRPYCILEYGSDGFKSKVKLDVGFGCRVTVAGNYLSALIGMDAPPLGETAGIMTIGAAMSFFAAPSQAPVTQTVYIDAIGSLSVPQAAIPRPSKAVALLPPQCTDLSATTQLDFYDSGAALLYSLQFSTGSVVTPIPLTNDVQLIILTYTGIVAATNYRLPFQLAL